MPRFCLSFWLSVGTTLFSLGAIADRPEEVSAIERFRATDTVTAQWNPKPLAQSPSAPFWVGPWNHSSTKVGVYPQATVRLNDRDVNRSLSEMKPKEVEIKVAYNLRELGVWLQWSDVTFSRLNREESSSFGDAIALEIPLEFGGGKRLPYIGMGDSTAPVYIAQLRSFGDSVMKREYLAKGYGTLQPLKQMPWNISFEKESKMEYDGDHRRWRALFYFKEKNPGGRKKVSLLQRPTIPIGLAIWDGGLRERGGNKLFSAWKFIRLPKNGEDKEYLSQLSVGYQPSRRGDPVKGKEIFLSACTGCHRFESPPSDDPENLRKFELAPNLEFIGATTNYSYLKESILDPDAVILKNLNPLKHYDRSNPLVANVYGQYPINLAAMWHFKDGEGAPKSKMPRLGLPPEMIDDIIAFLRRRVKPSGGGD